MPDDQFYYMVDYLDLDPYHRNTPASMPTESLALLLREDLHRIR